MREILLGIAATACVVCIVIGVAHWSDGAAWIVGGVLGAVVAYLALLEDDVAPVDVDVTDDDGLVE